MLILATRNAGKVKEIRHILGTEIQVRSLADFPNAPEVIEDGDTFEANAAKKALEIARHTNSFALADDSGLEVDALNGAPGVYSARFAGENATDADNNHKLLELLKNIPPEKRTARFRCVIAIATPEGTVHTAAGTCEGQISQTFRGARSFGYDPLFFVPEFNLTFAELPLEDKNRISHRGRALQTALPLLRALLLP